MKNTYSYILFFSLVIMLNNINASDENNKSINLPEIGDRVSGAVSEFEESLIGKEFLKQIYSQAPLITDPLIEEYSELLIYRLSEYSRVKDRSFKVLLIDDKSLNAFAAPGGIIGINGGLFLYAETEAQFASIMCHELAHLSQRHFARNILQAQDTNLSSALILVSSIALALISNNPTAVIAGPAFIQQQNLRYSRSFERESDRVGFNNLVSAGYNPEAMGEMFEIMNALRRLYGDLPPEFLLTHPITSSRISDAFNAAEKVSKKNKKNNTKEYSFIRSRIKIQYEQISSNSLRYFQNRVLINEIDENIYGLALAYSKNQMHAEAIKEINKLIKQDQKNLFLNTTKAEILINAKKYDEALILINEFLNISPYNYPLSILKSNLLLELDQYLASEEIIRDMLITKNDNPNLWMRLSSIQYASKNIIGYYQSQAEYYILQGKNEEALIQLELALNLSKNNFQESEKILTKIMYLKDLINKSRGL